MANECFPDDLGELWRGQKVEQTQMSIDELRERARKFQRRIRLRNLTEDAARAAAIVLTVFSMWKYTPLMRAAGWLCIAGMLYVSYQTHRRGSNKKMAAELTPASCLDFHRRELERQRDLLRGIWSWYLGPLIPGLALFIVAASVARPSHLKYALKFDALYVALLALGFYIVVRLNRRAARCLQRQIDDLNALS